MSLRIIKHPVVILISLFIFGYFALQWYIYNYSSSTPVVLSKANPPQIILYGTQRCMYCHIAKQFFKKHQLPFTEYDVDKSAEHRQTFHQLGGYATPLLVINQEVIYGFNEQRIREAL